MRRIILAALFFVLYAGGAMAQDSASKADYFVTAEIDNPTPFVGQQITYRVRFYDRTDVADPLYEAPDYEGFWRIDKHNSAQTTEVQNGATYKVTVVETALFPTRAGKLNIPPAKVLLPETVFRAKEELQSNPVAVQARPLPGGAPANFSGAVGQFTLSAALDRSAAKVGEPIKLTLTVSGTGNVEQLPMPPVTAPDGWRVIANPASYTVEEKDGLMVGSNTYTISLVAGKAGQATLPPITLHYFDPAKMAYLTVQANSITLEGTGDIASAQVVTDVGKSAVLAIKPALIGTGGVYPAPPFWLLWLLPPVAAIGFWMWQRREQRMIRDAAQLRKLNALRQAQTQLQTALNMTSPEVCARVMNIIYAYWGDRLNREPRNLTEEDIARTLHAIPAQIREAVILCLETAEEGRYAPSSAVDVRSLVSRTAEALARLDQAWKQP
jgi:hypothetical protein